MANIKGPSEFLSESSGEKRDRSRGFEDMDSWIPSWICILVGEDGEERLRADRVKKGREPLVLS